MDSITIANFFASVATIYETVVIFTIIGLRQRMKSYLHDPNQGNIRPGMISIRYDYLICLRRFLSQIQPTGQLIAKLMTG